MVRISRHDSAAGDWRICREQVTLFRDMRLTSAIRLAREIGRYEHVRLGCQVRVEMPGRGAPIVLANFIARRRDSISDDEGVLAA